MNASKNKKEKAIYSLSVKILELMSSHPDRWEAIDACDIARILFRKDSKNAQSLRGDRQSCV
jgi:hypothetical protein